MDRVPATAGTAPGDLSNLLPAPIGQAEQEQLLVKLRHEYDQFKSSVAPLHERIDRNHELYEAGRGPDKTFPWKGASNYTVPLIMATCDSMHARLVKAVFEVDPLWLARPRTAQAVDKAKKAESYLDVWADTMNLKKTLDMTIHNTVVEGTGILKMDWTRKVAQLPSAAQPDGTRSSPGTVTEYDGPGGQAVPLKDFVMIPADAPTIDDAVYVGHRVFRTHQQLLDRQFQGFYFNVEKLLDISQGDSTTDRSHAASKLAGAGSEGSQYKETRQYEVVELYGPYDWGDGPVPTLFAFSPEHDVLLRLEPYPYEYGRSPYIDFTIYPEPNFFWGRGVPELLESSQEELTALHNMRADALTRSIAPPLVKLIGSSWDPDEDNQWGPGSIIEVANLGEVDVLQIPDVPGSLFATEQDIWGFAERVSGMSDYFMGVSPSQNRTATEVNRVTSEGLARMDVSISRFQESMRKVAWVLWWLLYQYRPAIDSFVAGDQEFNMLKTDMLPGANGLMPFEFIPQGELSDASKDARRQQLIFLLQTAAGPLSQFYPDGLQKLLNRVFDAYDIKDAETILGPDWSIIQQQLQQAFQAGAQQGMEQGAKAAQDAG